MISTSVGTGLGALADEINKNADKTGVRATFTVETRGISAVRAGATSDDFAINGVKIGKVDYKMVMLMELSCCNPPPHYFLYLYLLNYI